MRLLCVGESFTDLIFTDLPRMPRPGEELRTRGYTATVGGGAVITAVAATRLGLRARVVSALGPDGARRLRAEGVPFVNLLRRGEPAAVSVSLSTRADRSFVTFDGVNAGLEPRLLRRLRRLRAPLVHFALAPRDCAAWVRALEMLRAAGARTSWDFGWDETLASRRGFRALLSAVDVLFLNEQEALMYAGARTLPAALDVWRRRAGTTVIKMGGRGSLLLSGDDELRAPVRRRRPVDTTGAGDAFNGGFLAGIARGLGVAACLRLANRVGAASTSRAGGLDGLPFAAGSGSGRR